MTNEPKNSPSDPDISDLYASMAIEQPSTATDEAILQAAKRHANKANSQSQTNSKIKTWRKWQWPTSIAASVVFVSVIMYGQFNQFDPNLAVPSSAPVDTYAIADNATLDEQQAMQRQQLEMKKVAAKPIPQPAAQLPDVADITEQSMAEPALSNYAEQEAAGLAASALDNVELDIIPDEFKIDPMDSVVAQLSDPLEDQGQAFDQIEMMRVVPLEQEKASAEAQMRQQLMARQAQQSRKRAEAAAQREQARVEEIVVTGSRVVRSEQTAPIKNDYLDSLVSQLKALKNKTPSTPKLDKDINELQETIFDYLMLQKTLDPTLVIADETLSLLTKEQQLRLLD